MGSYLATQNNLSSDCDIEGGQQFSQNQGKIVEEESQNFGRQQQSQLSRRSGVIISLEGGDGVLIKEMVTSSSGDKELSYANAAFSYSDGGMSEDHNIRTRDIPSGQSQSYELRGRGSDVRKDYSASHSDRSSSESSKESVAMSMIQAVRCNVDMLMGGRSSIAMERLSASIDITRPSSDIFNNNKRKSLAATTSKVDEVFAAEADQMLTDLPSDIKQCAQLLAVLMKDTPVPISAIQMLWNIGDVNSAIQIASVLESKRIIKSAILDNGSIWILVPWDTLRLLQAFCKKQLVQYHQNFMGSYAALASGVLTAVPDDGYLYQSISYHLTSAQMFDELRILLMAPLWLELKTRYYGAASVVEDFRRYLRHRPETDIKLLLQAFQMSESCCQEFPNIFMLGQQLLGRLLAVSESPDLPLLRSWCQRQEEGYGAALGSTVRYLLPRTPTLNQAGGLLRMTLRGHTAPINALALSPDGLRLLTASSDTTIKVWDMEIGDCTATLDFHSGSVTCVVGVPNSNLAMTGGDDGFVVVWDLEQGQYKSVLPGHKGRITNIRVDSSGKLAISSSADSTAKIWNLGTGKCLNTLNGHGGACLHLAVVWDGDFVGKNRIVTGADDFTGRIWDASTGKCLHILEGHSGWVVSVAGMSSTNRAVTASHDGSARLWDVESGECLNVFEGHGGRLNKVVLSHDEATVFTASDDYSAMMWKTKQNECAELEGHEGWISDIATSRDGTIAVTGSGDQVCMVWDLETGNCTRTLEGHSAEISAVALTGKGRFVISASADCTARVWDLQSASVQVVDSHLSRIFSMNVFGTTVVTTDENGGIFWWDSETGAVFKKVDGHDAPVRWSYLIQNENKLYAKELVTASSDRQIRVWDAETGVLLREAEIGGSGRLKSFAAAGNVALASLFDSTVWVVHLDNLKIQQKLEKLHHGGINQVCLDSSGELGLTISKDCTAQLLDLQEFQSCQQLRLSGKNDGSVRINKWQLRGHSDAVLGGCITGDTIVTCSYDKNVRVCVKQNCQIQELQTFEHTAAVNQVVVSPCNNFLVAILEDKTAWLWDINGGVCRAALKGHKEHIGGAVFCQDSSMVCTFSDDCTLNVWSVRDGSLVAFYLADCQITTAKFINRQNQQLLGLAAGDVSGLLHFMDLPNDLPI